MVIRTIKTIKAIRIIEAIRTIKAISTIRAIMCTALNCPGVMYCTDCIVQVYCTVQQCTVQVDLFQLTPKDDRPVLYHRIIETFK